MNRSFKAEESGQRKRQPLMGSIRSSDEELSLFLEMRRRESDRNNNRFLQKSDEFDPLGSKSGSSPAFNIASAAPLRRTRADEFLNADNDKTDYDCLSTADMGKLISSVRMETRMMMTGMHTVADIFCVCCGSIVGWKYETAHETSQKYKEGKSVLERFKLSGPDGSHYWASHETHVAGSDADDV